MEYLTIDTRNNHYICKETSNLYMETLCNFLTDDIGGRPETYIEWIFDEKYLFTSSNATELEKNFNQIWLSSIYADEEYKLPFKVTIGCFLQLLDDWSIKVLKPRPMPREIKISYDGKQFIFETK